MAWYAMIVAAMTAAFGTLTHVTVQRLLERELDERLLEQATALADVLVPEEDGTFRVELSPDQISHFQDESPGAIYYRIWNAQQSLVDTSHPELAVAHVDQPGPRTRGDVREMVVKGPEETHILVGRSLNQEQAQLKRLAGTSVAVGLFVLLPFLGGGWFLTSRALAPIERISRAAAAVSTSNQNERIEVSRMEAELAELARTVNEAFDRLQDTVERQKRFTADASHELRTPLSVIMARADLALKSERTPDEYREALTVVRHAASRMNSVVEGLLTLARADSGEVPLQPGPCEIHVIVAEVCQLLQPLILQRELTVESDLVPVQLMGDRERIREAVSNVLCNAVQYNRSRGAIRIQLREKSGQAFIRVEDTGIGIPDSQQSHLFDRFFRGDESRSGHGDRTSYGDRSGLSRGSGLGLAITKWIVEAHGGSIEVTSREGEGTVVSLRLGSL